MKNKILVRPKVYMVDSVGAHRGMHYYNFALVSALHKAGLETILISNEQTSKHNLLPTNISVREGFVGIYGEQAKWLRGIKYILSLIRIGIWAARERPDILHFHFFQMPLIDYLLLLWLRCANIRTVSTVHDVLSFDMEEKVIDKKKGKAFLRLYKASSGLIVQTQHTLQMLARLDNDLINKCATIPQGNYLALGESERLTIEDASGILNIAKDGPIILILGSIKPNKRLDLVIESMVTILKRHPRTKLYIVGKPWQQDVTPFKELAEKLGVARNISWDLEYVSDLKMAAYYSLSDIIVFPYQWIYQSAALVMAMSFGKAIVATRVGSNAEFIENGRTGLLVTLNDVSSMAQAILSLLENKEIGKQLGNAAMDFVATTLSWDSIAQKTIRLYEEVTGSSLTNNQS